MRFASHRIAAIIEVRQTYPQSVSLKDPNFVTEGSKGTVLLPTVGLVAMKHANQTPAP